MKKLCLFCLLFAACCLACFAAGAENRLTLMAENPLFDPINLVGEEMNQATILGKAVAVVSFLNNRNL